MLSKPINIYKKNKEKFLKDKKEEFCTIFTAKENKFSKMSLSELIGMGEELFDEQCGPETTDENGETIDDYLIDISEELLNEIENTDFDVQPTEHIEKTLEEIDAKNKIIALQKNEQKKCKTSEDIENAELNTSPQSANNELRVAENAMEITKNGKNNDHKNDINHRSDKPYKVNNFSLSELEKSVNKLAYQTLVNLKKDQELGYLDMDNIVPEPDPDDPEGNAEKLNDFVKKLESLG